LNYVEQVKDSHPSIMRQMENTKRDAKNCRIRAEAKLLSKTAKQVRVEVENK